ncbi:MAG: hypothetical protein MJE68_00165 [Proteobacteria bacterium]|nr:hypothetical protein [Pseudomonadota bacterium]
MAHAQAKPAPMGATMKANTEQRLDSAERNIVALWAGKIGWRWGVPAVLVILGAMFLHFDGRFNDVGDQTDAHFERQYAHNIKVDDRLLALDINQVESKAEIKQLRENQDQLRENQNQLRENQELILQNQQEILDYIRSQPPSQRAPPAQ